MHMLMYTLGIGKIQRKRKKQSRGQCAQKNIH